MNHPRKKPKTYAVTIKVVGLAVVKTERAIINIEEALVGIDGSIAVEWISDPHAMSRLGPLQLPSVFVNDELKISGRIPSIHEIRLWVEEVLQETVSA